MALRLPDLDDLRWNDLVEEGRSLIPATAPEWTNHNPSDPGITLVELLAYVSERLMYQLNRIPDSHTLEFLNLIHGRDPDGRLERPLLKEKRALVSDLQAPRRAVTKHDVERLAMGVPWVARAVCIARRNLESEDPAVRASVAPGHVTVVVIAQHGVSPSRELLYEVKQVLEPARLLTTRVHVVAPRYLRIGLRLTIVPKRGASAEAVRERVLDRVKSFFDPLTGWITGKGWPLGRNVYVSELYQVLGGLDAIDLVTASRDINGERMDELVLDPAETGRLRRNERGELEVIELRAAELIEASIAPKDLIVVAHA
jgi:Baseplate J-like protein